MPLLIAPQYVGITPVSAHVRRAMEFTQKTDVYLALGKTSAWPDDTNPPTPSTTSTLQAGTITTAGTAVTGTGTAFTALDVGRLVFVGSDVRTVATVTDATHATLGTALPANVTASAFSLSPAVEEIVGFVKVEQKTLVVPDVGGAIEVYGANWRAVANNAAYTEQARRVWLKGQFAYDAIDVSVSYRAVGVYSGLVRESVDEAAFPGKTVLLPANVTSAGTLEFIYYDRPIPRAINRRDVLNVIITF